VCGGVCVCVCVVVVVVVVVCVGGKTVADQLGSCLHCVEEMSGDGALAIIRSDRIIYWVF
jgi:hypothetical protein